MNLSDGAEGLFATHGGSLYYVVNREGESELWRTDGSDSRSARIDSAASIHSLTAVGDNLLYVASNASGSESLGIVSGAGFFPLSIHHTELTSIANLAVAGGKIFFTADDGTDGLDLWSFDSASSQVALVRDFQGGLDGSALSDFTAVGDTLFFTWTVEFGGSSLWKSDGTEFGTGQVAMLGSPFGPGDGINLIAFDDTLFFTDYGVDPSQGGFTVDARLWRTDGSAGGTELIKTIPSATVSELTNVNGALYFAAWGAGDQSDTSLWKSDGTEQGTVLLKAIDNRDFSSGGAPANFVGVDGILYFTADDEVHGNELWRSDGTAAGTYMLRDTYPNYSGSFDDSPANLVNLNGKLYFTAQSPQYGVALWTSDGTTLGTAVVASLLAPTFVSVTTPPTGLGGPEEGRDVLFFAARGGNGINVGVSDGSAAGTRMLGETGIRLPGIAQPTSMYGKLFFIPHEGRGGTGLWSSNGSASGTGLVKGSDPFNNDPANNWSRFGNLFVFQNSLFFTADDGVHGEELWISDGTTDGTQLFADLAEGRMISAPRNFTVVGDGFYFTTHEGTRLWRSDGTAVGTVEFTSFVSFSFGSYATNLTNVDGVLSFLLTNDAFSGETALWKSDGTPGGTVLVKPLHYPTRSDFDLDLSQPLPVNVLPNDFFTFKGALYFSAEDGIHGRELWRSDGTPEGTAMVKDINQVFGAHPFLKSNPRDFIDADGVLYFTADDGVHGRELWTTDGTAEGTRLVANIRSDSLPEYKSADPYSIIHIGGTLYFGASDGGFEGSTAPAGDGVELWKSDGTELGTVQVKDINPGAWNSSPLELTAAGSDLYFSANDGGGWYLWKSDGTREGTDMVLSDIRQVWPNPHDLFSLNGTLFVVSDGLLWALTAATPAPEIAYKQRALVLNQDRLGHLASPATGDRWVFSANSGDQVRFDLGQTFGEVRFRLKGPDGWTGFDDQAADSGVLTLPHSGRYELEAYLISGSTGTYSFRLEQEFTELVIGETYTGTIAGTGYAQVFQIDVPFDGVLLTALDNAKNSDNIEIYLRRGAPPTRTVHDLRRERPGADHQLLIPNADAGTWYVLIYAAHAPDAGAFALRVDNPPVVVDDITPPALPNFEQTWLAIAGAGFDETTTVEFIAGNGAVRTPTILEFVSATSLRVLLDLGTWSADSYRVVVHKEAFSHELASPFVVTEEPYRLETRLIVPDRVGFGIPIRQTIWIEYSNTGRIPMPAPLLKLASSNGARLTADAELKPQRGFGVIAGTSDTIEVMGLGSSDTPWLLLPGETGKLPIYYLGLSQQGFYPDVRFTLSTLTANNEQTIDWDAQQTIVKPKNVSQNEWELSFGFLQGMVGHTWGNYAALLSHVLETRILDTQDSGETSALLAGSNIQGLWEDILITVGDFVDLIASPEQLGLDALPNVPNYPNCPDDEELYNAYLASLTTSSTLLSERLQFNQEADSLGEQIVQFYSTALSLVYDVTVPIVERVADVIGAMNAASLAQDAKDALLDFFQTVASEGASGLLRIASGRVIQGLSIFDSLVASGLTPPLSNFLNEFSEGQEYADALIEFNSFLTSFYARIQTLSDASSSHNVSAFDLKARIANHNAYVADYEDRNASCNGDLPVISLMGTTVLEGDVEWADPSTFPVNAQYATFSIAISEPAAETVTIQWSTSGGFVGTATPGVDYYPITGVSQFLPGTTNLQIAVPVIGDNEPENAEHFFLYIFAPIGAVIGAGIASATIQDDDADEMPPNFPSNSADEVQAETASSFDPNDLLGPAGHGPEHFIPADTTLAYTVRFENEADATAPAREITITNPLEDDIDLDTLELTEITFANHTLFVPPGNDFFEDSVPLTVNGTEILVEVQAGVDHQARELFLTLRAIDPDTGWFSEDPLVGLLYPEDDTGRGQGSISYLVKPKAGLATGTVIENRASIVFDFNDPIATPLVWNTLDAAPPASAVLALPPVTVADTFVVEWSGGDEQRGSGIASFDIYIAIDDEPPVLYLGGTTLTSTTILVESGRRYSFFSVARDNVGHSEAFPLVPDVSTIAFDAQPWHNHRNPLDVNYDGFVSPLDVLLVINELNRKTFSDPITGQLPLPPRVNRLPLFGIDVSGDLFVSPLDALIGINYLNAQSRLGSGEGEGTLSPEPGDDGDSRGHEPGDEALTALAIETARWRVGQRSVRQHVPFKPSLPRTVLRVMPATLGRDISLLPSRIAYGTHEAPALRDTASPTEIEDLEAILAHIADDVLTARRRGYLAK